MVAWDTGGLPPVFRLAQLILLDHDAAGLQLLAELRGEGVLGAVEISTWRLFQRWRDQGLLN